MRKAQADDVVHATLNLVMQDEVADEAGAEDQHTDQERCERQREQWTVEDRGANPEPIADLLKHQITEHGQTWDDEEQADLAEEMHRPQAITVQKNQRHQIE